MKSPRPSLNKGFTLLELSIVLVIIGLVVGGVLVGQDLIKNAELRGDIGEVQKFDTAAQTFRLQYAALPGDMLNATDFWAEAKNGDGSGYIDGMQTEDYPPPIVPNFGQYTNTELAYAVDDLARAQLINVAPFDANSNAMTSRAERIAPRLKSNGGFVVTRDCTFEGSLCMAARGHAYRLGIVDNSVNMGQGGQVSVHAPIYSAKDAFYIDAKIDDGRPWTGTVYVGPNQYGDAPEALSPFYPQDIFTLGGAECVLDTTSNQYAVTRDDKACGIFIRASY